MPRSKKKGILLQLKGERPDKIETLNFRVTEHDQRDVFFLLQHIQSQEECNTVAQLKKAAIT